MTYLDADPELIQFTLKETRKDRDKAIEALKKSNMKVKESLRIINMLTDRLNIEDFTLKECDDIKNYIDLCTTDLGTTDLGTTGLCTTGL